MAEEKKRKRKKLEELPLGDTFMFNKVFCNEPLMRRFLEKALEKKIGKISFIETEKALEPDLGLKPIRMDIFIQEENQNFNVEMQTHNLGPLPQRGRWYKTTYDKSLRAAEQYADIKPFYLIFICDYDIIELEEKSGYARYTRTSYWEENMVPAEDGYHLIVFNTRYKKDEMHTHMVDNEILELLDYIRTDDDSATYQGDLANKSRDAVHRLRMDPVLKEEYKVVSMYIAGQRAEAFAEGESEGIKKNKLCFKYLKEGYSPAQIAAALGEDLDKIQEPLKAAQDMIAM